MNHKQTVAELAEEANIKNPFKFSSWIFMRAAGVDKNEAANMIGVHRNTLQRYEKKALRNLSQEERFRLIRAGFNYEYEERMQ